MSLLLEGKRAFVSGGTRGIGAAICEVFAREGADVAFNYHSSDALADEVRAKIEAHGRRALSYKVSVTDRYGMKHIAREIKDAWGPINVLVNNAAVNKGDNFATTTDKSWDWVVDTNVNSLFAVTKPFYKQMIRERSGSILNITSVGAIRSLPTSVHYATSKAAMMDLLSVCRARPQTSASRSMLLRPAFSIPTSDILCQSDFCRCMIFGSRRGASVGPRSSRNMQPL